MIDDERFRTRDMRVKNFRELDAAVTIWTASHSTATIMDKLHAQNIPAAEVRNPAAAVRDPRVVARQDTVVLAHPKYGAVEDVYGMGMPLKFSSAASGFDQPPPALGEHNRIVYGEILGYDADKIDNLRREHVI